MNDAQKMPDKGTSTGVVETYGAKLDVEAANQKGSAANSTQPSPPDHSYKGK